MKFELEPVFHEAAVQDDFERSQERGDEQEAYQIEADVFIGRRALMHQHKDKRHRPKPNRAVDEEVPLPRVVVGDPAAKRRANNGRDNDRNPEKRESLTAFLRRKGVRQNRLRHRHHAAAADSLQDAEQEKRLQIPGHAAQDGAQRE